MNIAIIQILLAVIIGYSTASDKSWTYEMKSITTRTSNEELVDLSFYVERISRGVYALSGELKINLDIVESDTTEIEGLTFRSPHSDGNYQRLSFEMSRRHFFDALNTHYKDILMDTLKDCSDLPSFEDEFVPPFEKKTYKLSTCQISQDGLPSHMEVGTYKIVIAGYGDVEWELEVVVDIEQNDALE